jgi:hypothetical protein
MRRGLAVVVGTLGLVVGWVGRAGAQDPKPSPSPAVTAAPAAAPAPDAPPVKVSPYGVVYFSGYNNNGGVNNTDVPLWAIAGGGSTGATGRQSRIGLRMTGPPVLGAKLSGVVEGDFLGGFPMIGTSDNFGQFRLRLANARLDWSKASLVLGQDWMVFAPQNPATLVGVAIPLFAAAGNPWARLPQVKVEYRGGSALGQLAVLSPSSGDFTATFFAQPSSGMASKVPFLQGRLALTSKDWWGSGKPAAVGVSGHFGRSRITPAAGAARNIDSNGGALDLNVPLGAYVTVVGEAYAGTNLAGFQSGVFQGINPDAVPSAGVTAGAAEGIGTTGGWAQLGVTPGKSKVILHAAYGLDDPDDADLLSATRRDWRLKNQVLALGVTHRSSAQLSLGLEYRYLKTRFLQSGNQDTHHVSLAAMLAF